MELLLTRSRHFLDIDGLSLVDAGHLLQRAASLKRMSIYPRYPHVQLATLFYENSTRTRLSFELAAHKLGCFVVRFDAAVSSESKGELMQDTLQTLAALGVHGAVIRHPDAGVLEPLASMHPSLYLINAGDGTHAHPTQAMLDLMTIIENKPAFPVLKIAVVGDLRRSRVVNSFQAICRLYGVSDLVLISPQAWRPHIQRFGRWTDSLHDGLDGADVVITLRVQRERFLASESVDAANWQDYALTTARLKYAKADAIVMHPGPVNRGVEMVSELVDGPQSCILQQVHNGVYMRMAILEWLLGAA